MQTPKRCPLVSKCKMWRDILPALQWILVPRIVLAPDGNPGAKQLYHNYNTHGYSQNSTFPQLRSHQRDPFTIHNTWVLLISKYFYCIAAHLSEITAWVCCLMCVFNQLRTKLWTGCSFGCSPSPEVAWNPLLVSWALKSQDKMHSLPGCLTQLFYSSLTNSRNTYVSTHSTGIQDLRPWTASKSACCFV